MFFLPANYRHPAFKQGMRDIAPVAPGIAAWGLMTGVAMVKSGMSIPCAVLMTLTVFAGSSQLAAIPLLASGTPMWVILATGFCVILRFIVFSAHFKAYMMSSPRWQRMIAGYLSADITYVQFTQRYPTPYLDAEGHREQMAYLAGNNSLNWAGWVLAGLLGVFLASFIPTEWGLGFAGVLALVGVTCSLMSSRMRVISAVTSATVAIATYALPLKLNIVLSIACAVCMCVMIEQMSKHQQGEPL